MHAGSASPRKRARLSVGGGGDGSWSCSCWRAGGVRPAPNKSSPARGRGSRLDTGGDRRDRRRGGTEVGTSDGPTDAIRGNGRSGRGGRRNNDDCYPLSSAEVEPRRRRCRHLRAASHPGPLAVHAARRSRVRLRREHVCVQVRGQRGRREHRVGRRVSLPDAGGAPCTTNDGVRGHGPGTTAIGAACDDP